MYEQDAKLLATKTILIENIAQIYKHDDSLIPEIPTFQFIHRDVFSVLHSTMKGWHNSDFLSHNSPFRGF